MRHRHNRTRQIAAGALSLLVLAATLAGLPALLYAVAGGSPVPHTLPGLHQLATGLARRDNGTLFLATLRDVAWLGWAYFAFSTAVEAAWQVRGKTAPALGRPGGVQHLSRTLVASVVVAFTAASGGLPAVLPAVAAAAATAPAPHHPGRPVLDAAARHDRPTGVGGEVTVPRGADLWDIAELHAGHGERWPELWHLNRGRVMPSGARFTDPNLVDAGFRLWLPASWVPHPAPDTNGAGHRDRQAAGPGHETGGAGPQAAAAPGAAEEAEAAGPPVTPQAAGLSTTPSQPGDRPAAPATWEAFTAGMLAGGLLAGGLALRLGHGRHQQRQQRPPGRRIALPVSGQARRAEHDLRTAAATPLPGVLRGTLAALADGLRAGGRPVPPITGVHLTRDWLEVLLTSPDPAPPAPFTVKPGTQDQCWVLSSAAWGGLPATNGAGRGDLLPGLVTIGTTGYGGHLLADLEALGLTTVDGPPRLADMFLTGAGLELATNPWAGSFDLLLAGFGEFAVDGRAQACATLDEAIGILAGRAARGGSARSAPVRDRRLHDPAGPDWTLTLLVSRIPPDPAQMAQLLDAATPNSGIAAIVAGDIADPAEREAPASLDLREHPDQPGAMAAVLHPLELLLTVPALGEQHHQAIAEILRAAAAPHVAPEDPPYHTAGLADTSDSGTGPAEDGQDPQWQPDAASVEPPIPPQLAPEPGAGLHIRILGPFQITGAAASLQPKHRELVLALALAGPTGLANSALRTFLGADPDSPKSPDALRQMITRTRRELGQTPDGGEYIVHTGNACYVLDAAAWLDWHAFRDLAQAGRAAQDRGLLWDALALIRGQALDGVYHWWVEPSLPERIRAEITDTASDLADLELAAGNPAAAARAARTGLAADRTAERLWRAVMHAEDLAGNTAGVHQAWQGCRAALAEVGADVEPHEETTALYCQLTRRPRVAAPA